MSFLTKRGASVWEDLLQQNENGEVKTKHLETWSLMVVNLLEHGDLRVATVRKEKKNIDFAGKHHCRKTKTILYSKASHR